MSFGTQDSSDEVMNEINMTPLVDVMLVLLIIFIITVPVMKHSVNVDLPRATNQPEDVKPETVRLSVSADGKYYWNESEVTEEELFPRLQAEAAKEPQPDLHIRGDKAVRYEKVATAMAAAQRAGVRKIGFVTDPQQQARHRGGHAHPLARHRAPQTAPRPARGAFCVVSHGAAIAVAHLSALCAPAAPAHCGTPLSGHHSHALHTPRGPQPHPQETLHEDSPRRPPHLRRRLPGTAVR